MYSSVRRLSYFASLTFMLVAIAQTTDAQIQNPILYLTHTEAVTTNGKEFIRYHYDILNKDSYPMDLFAAAPTLPPCGTNAKASRTWVDFYDQSGKRLNGFCALGSPKDLSALWIALESNVLPPSWVYVEFTDRQTNTKYKSNLAETTQ
jgi:hypothetical protein